MRLWLLLTLLAASGMGFASKVYQWRDNEGNVFYSDRAPTHTVAKERTIRSSLPAPVTDKPADIVLWITPQCGPNCEAAQALLEQSKLRYALKTANPSQEDSMLAFFNAANTLQARPPILIIEKTILKEFNLAQWQAAISQAQVAPKQGQ
ncbi:DUF4124 domain-containing protein [Deefgea salmonis]|uniref:DUF4124 domain-containing protein n=1 Tax=Deefgea salmonis TaxID=2875502 RepID=A0ABS8BHQ1_9NEIS|nr:DUF4124 domain-containing protein [Deefgea salmonis]MCB5195126.1 DUF4124 domain-containing protein [Deefgea salmonis]